MTEAEKLSVLSCGWGMLLQDVEYRGCLGKLMFQQIEDGFGGMEARGTHLAISAIQA